MAASKTNTDFLRFSAYSIKDAITRKLSEDSRFTDQVFEGSNLAILIDIVSYMYQCLIYQLNTAASESMFADTQLYENITRLVKFIGYNPKGCTTSTLPLYISRSAKASESLRRYKIPQYTRIDTGLSDSLGKKIYFSFASTRSDLNSQAYYELKDNSLISYTIYNGEWKMYNTVFTASGIDNEEFFLSGIKSNTADQAYVAHDFIDVYVGHFDPSKKDDAQYTCSLWELDKNGIFTGYTEGASSSSNKLFNNETPFKSIYPGNYEIYTVNLNEDKTYSIKFGNGIVGKKLSPGDKIYVFYLDTNGLDGKIDLTTINTTKLKFDQHDPSMFGMSDYLYQKIFDVDDDQNLTFEDKQDLYNLSFGLQESTSVQLEESVDEIRENAPLWFTTGNRLVTKFDYEYFIKNSRNSASTIGCDVVDCKCMNNWDYMAKFYKWLYDLGENGKYVEWKDYIKYNKRDDGLNDKTYYLKKDIFTRYDYFYADSADANNLYIWIKSRNDFDVGTVTATLNSTLNPIKLMTAELVACKAIPVYFDICAAPVNYVLDTYFGFNADDGIAFDSGDQPDSYIEITLDDNILFVSNSLQNEIANIIIDAFDVNKCQLGECIKYDDILNQIYELNGVQKVRTIFNPPDSSDEKPRVYDGLSFASWSNANNLIVPGDDLNISNNMRHLEDFQFPEFFGINNLSKKIKIIKKSLSQINTIKF